LAAAAAALFALPTGLYDLRHAALWRNRDRKGKLAPPRYQVWKAAPDAAARRQTRRQIRSRPYPRVRHRLSGAGAAVPDAKGARPPQRTQYRGLCHRLSRLAAPAALIRTF